MPIPRSDILVDLPNEGPTTIDMIARLQEVMGKDRYRVLLDTKRRPDGVNIEKGMRQCIEELYSELEK
jgi:hypothetical protein